jgi:hypothetical protein
MTSDATRRNGEIVTATGFAIHLAGVSKSFRAGNAELITAVNDASLDPAAGDTAALTGNQACSWPTSPPETSTRPPEPIVDLLLALNAEHGTTLVIATHDPAIAERCHHVIRMRDGRITGPPPVSASDDTPAANRA